MRLAVIAALILAATAHAADPVTLEWTPPTHYTDGSPIETNVLYRVYVDGVQQPDIATNEVAVVPVAERITVVTVRAVVNNRLSDLSEPGLIDRRKPKPTGKPVVK